MEFTRDSDYFAPTFKMVVEHIYKVILNGGPQRDYAKEALEILLTLVKKTTLPLVESGWINKLLINTVCEIDDDTFDVLLGLSARREGGDTAADPEMPSGQDYGRIQRGEPDPQSPGEIVTSENPTLEYALFAQVLQNVGTCDIKKDGWYADAVYGGLITIRDIPGLGFYLPEVEFLQTLSKAMERGGIKPLRVRKAAYDVVLVAREGWLRSADLRQTLKDLDFPKKLHGVVIETGSSEHQRSFLEMTRILSEDKYWHPYLRKAMDIWLPLHREGPVHVLRILANVGGLILPGSDGYNVDKPLEKVMEDEWAVVPGRHVTDLTVDRLEPLAEVTKQFKKLLFTESDRSTVLAVVEQVISSLEGRRDGYGGPWGDVRGIIDGLLEELREPVQSSSRRSSLL